MENRGYNQCRGPELKPLNPETVKCVLGRDECSIAGAMEPLDIFPVERDDASKLVIVEITIKVGMVRGDVWEMEFECIPQPEKSHVERWRYEANRVEIPLAVCMQLLCWEKQFGIQDTEKRGYWLQDLRELQRFLA